MKIRSAGLLTVAFVVLVSATTARAESFFAYLSGAQEVPPVATTARGYARVFLNESAGTITYTVVYTGLGSNWTASHIHAPAPIGSNVGVAINFPGGSGTSGTLTGTASITPTQITQLREGLGYVNVHSMGQPGGEIRGQLARKRPVDFDGDGRQDYGVLRFPNVAPPGAAPITYWNMNSTTGFQSPTQWGNANTDFPTPGDYDGDGNDDIAIYRAGASVGAQSEYWFLRSSDAVAVKVDFGLAGDQAVNRDYDGDGITDIAIFRRGAAQGDQANWWIRRSTAPSTFLLIPFGTTGPSSGASGDTPIPGDYDGDGKFDIAVYRFGGLTPNNTFIVRRSSDGTVRFQTFGNFSTDYVLPGDYDGDGKFDYAVARTGTVGTSPMQWWILQSSNGLSRTQTFGISSDLPVQGDYDGDGRTDLAIYRRGATASSQSTFWVFNSHTASPTAIQWGLQADFPVANFDAR